MLECLVRGRSTRNFLASRLISRAQKLDTRNFMKKQRALFRASFNALEDLSDIEFRNRYRLTKEAFLLLCEELEELTSLKSTQRVLVQIKASLSFL